MMGKKLCIDPGHGGSDPGGSNKSNQKEKDVVLRICLAMAQQGRERGLEIMLTRNRDVDVELDTRYRMANGWGADLFMSVHTNAAGGRGLEVLYGKPNARQIALDVVQALHRVTGWPIRRGDGLWYRPGVAVLRGTMMPAVLSECGFIDDPTEAAAMKQDEWIRTVARAHIDVACKYLGESPREEEEEDMPRFEQMKSRTDVKGYVYSCGNLRPEHVLCIHAEGPGMAGEKIYELTFYCVMKAAPSPPPMVERVGGWEHYDWHGGDLQVGALFPDCGGECRMSIHSPVELAIEVR